MSKHKPMRARGSWCVRAGKVAHFSHGGALIAMEKLKARPDCYGGDALNVYQCMSHWHVGHSSRREAAA